jgi:hypothetical protein
VEVKIRGNICVKLGDSVCSGSEEVKNMKILRHTDGLMPDTFPSEKLNCASGSSELKSLGLEQNTRYKN